MHSDIGQLHRWLDDELPKPVHEAITAHVRECVSCQAQVTDAQAAKASLHGALQLLDAPAPQVRLSAIFQRARARRSVRRRWLVAATLFIGLTGVAVASPRAVREWVGRMVSRSGIGTNASQPPRGPAIAPPLERPVSPSRTEAATAGIAVVPGRSFRVDFVNAPRSGTLSIHRSERLDVAITTPAGAATFTSSTDRVQVKNTSQTADYSIEIPADSPRIEIWIGDRRVYLKAGARVECVCTAQSATGGTVAFGAAPRR